MFYVKVQERIKKYLPQCQLNLKHCAMYRVINAWGELKKTNYLGSKDFIRKFCKKCYHRMTSTDCFLFYLTIDTHE